MGKGGNVRFLVAICVIFLALNVTIPYAFATSEQNCAPYIPPVVPGTLTQPPLTPGVIVINELLTATDAHWECPTPDGSSHPNSGWLELYNPQNQPFDLYSVHANIDAGSATSKFTFPYGSAIAAHGFFVVFPLLLPHPMKDVHLLQLSFNATIIDQVTYPDLSSQSSFARIPDGSNNWQVSNFPTIDGSNALTQNVTTPTTTHHKKKGDQNGGNHSQDNSNPNTPATTSNQTDTTNRIQPVWDTLHLPNRASSAHSTKKTASTTGITVPSSDTIQDTSKKILLTLMMIMLALSLLWCWRLFSIPSQ